MPLVIASAISAVLLSASEPVRECRGSESAPGLSHVVLAVDDLEAASARFRQIGFRLKQGRLHPNNLLNRHVKFRDGSGIELMTVQGEPRDAMARRYATLAAHGGGGVYVALDASAVAEPLAAAAAQQLEVQRSSSGSWEFISFSDSSSAAAAFFAVGVPEIQDPDSLVAHTPDVSGLAEAWIEGDNRLIAVLEALGARRCGTVSYTDGRPGERIGLSRGQLVVVPARAESRPRVLGVVLKLRSPGDTIVWPQRSFWVRFAFDP
jgi:catechol 2,3-dioxygenase-like lactoylglutathione lyase family enzyme